MQFPLRILGRKCFPTCFVVLVMCFGFCLFVQVVVIQTQPLGAHCDEVQTLQHFVPLGLDSAKLLWEAVKRNASGRGLQLPSAVISCLQGQ